MLFEAESILRETVRHAGLRAQDAWLLLDAGTSEELPSLRAALTARSPSPPVPTKHLPPPPPSAPPGRPRGRPKSSAAPKKPAGAHGNRSRPPPAPHAQRGEAAQESGCRRSRRLSGIAPWRTTADLCAPVICMLHKAQPRGAASPDKEAPRASRICVFAGGGWCPNSLALGEVGRIQSELDSVGYCT